MVQPHDLAFRQDCPKPPQFLELERSLESRVEDISPFVEQLMQFIKPFSDKFLNGDERDLDIEIAVREALANAVIHGNVKSPRKRVIVSCRCSLGGEVSITVRDEGQGFDHLMLPDPTDQENLLLTHGRGIRLMQALMDEVTFEERGTVVRMRKMAPGRVD